MVMGGRFPGKLGGLWGESEVMSDRISDDSPTTFLTFVWSIGYRSGSLVGPLFNMLPIFEKLDMSSGGIVPQVE